VWKRLLVAQQSGWEVSENNNVGYGASRTVRGNLSKTCSCRTFVIVSQLIVVDGGYEEPVHASSVRKVFAGKTCMIRRVKGM